MKKLLVILILCVSGLSSNAQTSRHSRDFEKKQKSNLVMGSDTAKYWYFKTKTYVLREPKTGYEWRSTMPLKWNKLEQSIPDGSVIVKLESIQVDSSKKSEGFLFLED